VKTLSLARVALVLACVGFLMGCAFGRSVDYQAPIELSIQGNSTQLALAVLDHRPYVVSGEKGPSFVGLQRSGYGIPFNVNTASGQPLADDFSNSIAGALSAKGFKVTEIALPATTSTDEAISPLVGSNSSRALLLEVSEWKTDTASRAALYYALALSVFDERGNRIAHKELSGRDNLGGSFWDLDPAASAADVAREAFKRKVWALFDDPEVKDALAGR
jgi:hypothetical protein